MRALVIEGGGMRAVYANGVLAALEDAGYRDFDAVYGTSAGGALAAWWSAGQARFALGTWQYAQDPRIISYPRWMLRRGPLLDHDALFRIVYSREHPLDVKRVRNASHPVIVTATDVDTGGTVYRDVREANDVLAWLRATGRLPLATGPPVGIDGRRYLDGGITDPIPIRRAVDDGATEIVCVLNRPKGTRGPEPRWVTGLVARRYPALADAVVTYHEVHNRSVALAESPPEGVRVHVIRPERDHGVSRLTRDPERLNHGMRAGLADGARFLARGRRVVCTVTSPPARAGRG